MLDKYAYFCVISACAGAVFAGSPTVTISAGAIIGTTLSPLNQPTSTGHANAYLGIPFAKSPPERFSPPEPPGSWENPLRAQELKPACIQQATGLYSLRICWCILITRGMTRQNTNAGLFGRGMEYREASSK